MKVTTIIFDVDGVLIDSNKIIVEYYIKTAKVLGLKIPSARKVFGLLGKSLPDIVESLWPNDNKDLIISTYRKFFVTEVPKIPAINGAIDAIKRLKEMGYKVGIASSKLRFFIDKHLTEAGFDLGMFDVIVSYETTAKHKPYPDPILYACKFLKIKPEEALYVGDGKYDYESARSAKVNYVAVLTGGINEKEQKKFGVKYILNSVSELPSFLEAKS